MLGTYRKGDLCRVQARRGRGEGDRSGGSRRPHARERAAVPGVVARALEPVGVVRVAVARGQVRLVSV
jgi:hypothetical protein